MNKKKSRSNEDFPRTRVTCTILKSSFTCQHFKMMGMSQRYADSYLSLVHVYQCYTDAHLGLVDVSQRNEDAKFLSGAPICAPASFQQYNLAVQKRYTKITIFYIIILFVQIKTNTWHTNSCKIGNN